MKNTDLVMIFSLDALHIFILQPLIAFQKEAYSLKIIDINEPFITAINLNEY